jgi:hypothetical protein
MRYTLTYTGHDAAGKHHALQRRISVSRGRRWCA